MKTIKYLILSILMLATIPGLHAQGLSADDIIRKADEKSRGLSSEGTLTMTVVRPDWTRTITMKSWSKGREYSLVLITAPAKEATSIKRPREAPRKNNRPAATTNIMSKMYIGDPRE